MQQDINRIMRRTRRYWYQDGFVEIAIGLLFSLVGIGVYLQELVVGNPTLLVAVIVGLMAFIVGSSLFVHWIVNRLKRRITYPRTGYLEYDNQRDVRGRWWIVAVALLLAILTLVIPEQFAGMGVVVGLTLLIGGVLVFATYLRQAPPPAEPADG